MCGIHGILSHSLPKEEIGRRVEEMGRLQQHRGPDDRREAVYPVGRGWLSMGFVRLSILDLETGMQPIECPKDNTVIICNGQIYNYVELRNQVFDEPFITRGDIEVVLHLYRIKGLSFLHDLNGMYAGAIFDPLRERFILFRDRFGIKPLYYTFWEENMVFSSEIKPLLAGSGLPIEMNTSGISTFFTYRYLPGEKTMFKGVRCLPPGSYLEYDLRNDTYKVERYWELPFGAVDHNMSLDDAAEELNALFADAVRIRLRSDVEVGSLLSSGIDSSAVASHAVSRRPRMKLFTMSFMEDSYNELPSVAAFLNRNKDRFGSTLHFTKRCGMEALNRLPEIVRSIEEPISLGAVLPTDQVCQLASQHVKVVLTGEGADEIFAGYRKFLVDAAAHQYPGLSLQQQREMEGVYPELKSYLSIRDHNPAKRYIQSEVLFSGDELFRLTGHRPPVDPFPRDAMPGLNGIEHPLNTALAMECRARLPDYVILRLDKLSMRHSLETRTPFLDYRLAELAAGLPEHFKVNLDLGRGKYICAYTFAKYSVLDEETAYMKKQPFTAPLADWFSNPKELPDFLREILLGDIIKNQGILNQDVVKELTKDVSSGGVGPQTLVSGADRVLAVVIFSLWFHEFFERGVRD